MAGTRRDQLYASTAPWLVRVPAWNPRRETSQQHVHFAGSRVSLAGVRETNLAARHAILPACQNLVHDEFGFGSYCRCLQVLAQSELCADVEPGDVASERGEKIKGVACEV